MSERMNISEVVKIDIIITSAYASTIFSDLSEQLLPVPINTQSCRCYKRFIDIGPPVGDNSGPHHFLTCCCPRTLSLPIPLPFPCHWFHIQEYDLLWQLCSRCCRQSQGCLWEMPQDDWTNNLIFLLQRTPLINIPITVCYPLLYISWMVRQGHHKT